MFEALRWRLTAWYVFVFAVVFAVVGVIVFGWASHRFAHDVDSRIRVVSDDARLRVAAYDDIAKGDADIRRLLTDANRSGSADVCLLLLGPNGFGTLATSIWASTAEAFFARAAAPALLLLIISATGLWLLLRQEA